jgi:hypothetical protein
MMRATKSATPVVCFTFAFFIFNYLLLLLLMDAVQMYYSTALRECNPKIGIDFSEIFGII